MRYRIRKKLLKNKKEDTESDKPEEPEILMDIVPIDVVSNCSSESLSLSNLTSSLSFFEHTGFKLNSEYYVFNEVYLVPTFAPNTFTTSIKKDRKLFQSFFKRPTSNDSLQNLKDTNSIFKTSSCMVYFDELAPTRALKSAFAKVNCTIPFHNIRPPQLKSCLKQPLNKNMQMEKAFIACAEEVPIEKFLADLDERKTLLPEISLLLVSQRDQQLFCYYNEYFCSLMFSEDLLEKSEYVASLCSTEMNISRIISVPSQHFLP